MLIFSARNRIRRLKDELESLVQKNSELERQVSSMQAILANMAEGVISVSADTRITSMNPAAEEMLGVRKQEAQGRFFLEVIRNSDIAEVVTRSIEGRQFISQEVTLVWPIHKSFQANVSPILENKAIKGCILVIHDITELRRLENIRRDFVANVSHELKTPLTSIKGFVETLREGALEDKENASHFLKIIEEHTIRLDNLINDLLALSYLESTQAALRKEDFNLRLLTDKVVQGFGSQLKKKSLSVKNEVSDLDVRADYAKIEQVLTNLIDNATKFNRDGGSIRVYHQDLKGMLKIIIEDTGFGIPLKDIPRIFERFYRVDKARSRELGGTGLGLSIVKHIVELHAGSVGVESSEGSGSRFWFTLPK